MMKRLAMLIAFALSAFAQQQQPQTARKPDCLIYFTLTNSVTTSAFVDDRSVGCFTWAAAYTSSGFTGLTVTVQESVEQSNTPVTWTTFTGTGNPATATDAAIIQLTGYPAWARVQISGLTGTGTVKGILFGFLAGSSSTGTGSGVTSLSGTPNEIAVSTATGAVTISIPNNPVLPGSASTAQLKGIINSQSGTSYTLGSSDNGKIIALTNAAAITLTVPSGLGAGFNCIVVQLGAGQVTPTASGTTIFNRQSFTKTAGQYAAATLLAYVADSFILGGDLQ